METVTHLWNVNQFMRKLSSSTIPDSNCITELQRHYIKKCHNFSRIVELPKQNFGPLVVCSHCGLLWNDTNLQVRISRGKKMSKSIKKIVQSMNENNQKTAKIRASLAKKCMKNEKNNLVFKCNVCHKITKLSYQKKSRLKLNDSKVNTVESNSKKKKKKKKKKDKFAGLNISISTPEHKISTPTHKISTPEHQISTPKHQISTPQSNKRNNDKVSTKTPLTTLKVNQKLTSITKKSKKLNVQRLKEIVQHNTPTKRNSLRGFLAGL